MTEKSTYKSCFVPHCKNTSITTPQKKFMCVPVAKGRRQKWFEAVGRKIVDSRTTYSCCEDHFDLERDMANYVRYKIMNGGPIRMKPDVVPHIFNGIDVRKDDPFPNTDTSESEPPSTQTPSNLMSTPTACDKKFYVVINETAAIQGVLIFKSDLADLIKQYAPVQNILAVGENRSTTDRYLRDNAPHEINRPKKDAAQTVKEESVKFDEDQIVLEEGICTKNDDVKLKEEIGSLNFMAEGIVTGGGTINTRDVSDEPEKNATGSEEIITQFVKKENLEICEEKLFQTEMEYTNCDKVKIVDSCDKVIKREPECFNENSAGSKFLKSTEEDVEIFEFADQKLQIKSDVEIYDEYSSDSPEYLSTTDVLEYGLQQEMSDKTAEAADSGNVCCVCNFRASDATALTNHKRLHLRAEVLEHEKRAPASGVSDTSSSPRPDCDDGIPGKNRPFPCPECPKSFGSRARLKSHCRVHADGSPYVCHVCKKRFKRRGNLTMHEKRHESEGLMTHCDGGDGGSNCATEDPDKNHVCSVCDLEFASARDLRCHRTFHPTPELYSQGSRLLTCRFCSKTFNKRWSLKCHEAAHAKGEPFSCRRCPKSFTQKRHLEKHSRTHDNVT